MARDLGSCLGVPKFSSSRRNPRSSLRRILIQRQEPLDFLPAAPHARYTQAFRSMAKHPLSTQWRRSESDRKARDRKIRDRVMISSVEEFILLLTEWSAESTRLRLLPS